MTSFCGSIDFLAPEIIQTSFHNINGHNIEQGYGKEVDIWAIGVISYAIMSGDLPFSDSDSEEDEKIMRHIVFDGVHFGPVWQGKSLNGIFFLLVWGMGGNELAKRFVRKCLSKRPGDRPTATEASGYEFVARSLMALNWLYEDLVLKSRVARHKHGVTSKTADTKEGEGKGENLLSETGEVMGGLNQMALCEIDMNGLDGRERKRCVIEVGECDQENEGPHDRRKRRKVAD